MSLIDKIKVLKNMVNIGKYVIIISSLGGDKMIRNEYSCYNRLEYLQIDSILPNPYQTRRTEDNKKLRELAESIKKYGLLQPIGVRLINKKIYELIFGERRLMACKLAGINTIPCFVADLSDRETAILFAEENIHRRDLHYLEVSQLISTLKNCFDYNEEQVSDILSMSGNAIEDYINFDSFSDSVKKMLIKDGITRDKAQLLLKTDDEQVQKSVINKVKEFKLNKEKTELCLDGELRSKMAGLVENNNRNVKKMLMDLRLFTLGINQAIALANESGMKSTYSVKRDGGEYKISITLSTNEEFLQECEQKV